MGGTFSIGEALGAAVRVIRRRPLAVFVWGLTMTLFSLVASVVVFGSIADLPLGDAAAAEPPPEALERMMTLQGLSMLLNVGQLVLAVVIWTATMRAVLRLGRPERAFFMRLGMDELRLGVVGIALFAGTYIAVIILVLLGLAVGAVVWQASEVFAGILGVVMVLGLIAAVVYAMARLSLIAPATLILQRFAFVEGWTLAKGRVGSLLGLLVCTWVIYLLIYFVVAFALIVLAFGTGVFAHLSQSLDGMTLRDLLPSSGALWGLVAILLLPGSFLYGAVMTLMCGPFAAACRALLDGEPMEAAPPSALGS